MGFSIGEVVKKTGLSAHTLRYYEKEGLLPFVTKSSSGLRVYTESDLGWLTMIECLKSSGLQIKEIAQYIKWFQIGDSTLAERVEMFRKRKAAIEEEMANLQIVLDKITYKTALYEEALKCGSLDTATNLPKMQKLKKKLFEKPTDFDKIMDQVG
ncbi:MAG: MerR family transcriptional regulator [Fibrobacter sp.]|nr:MerR family transcriptional regulator [Fibrobacter sp.]